MISVDTTESTTRLSKVPVRAKPMHAAACTTMATCGLWKRGWTRAREGGGGAVEGWRHAAEEGRQVAVASEGVEHARRGQHVAREVAEGGHDRPDEDDRASAAAPAGPRARRGAGGS